METKTDADIGFAAAVASAVMQALGPGWSYTEGSYWNPTLFHGDFLHQQEDRGFSVSVYCPPDSNRWEIRVGASLGRYDAYCPLGVYMEDARETFEGTDCNPAEVGRRAVDMARERVLPAAHPIWRQAVARYEALKAEAQSFADAVAAEINAHAADEPVPFRRTLSGQERWDGIAVLDRAVTRIYLQKGAAVLEFTFHHMNFRTQRLHIRGRIPASRPRYVYQGLRFNTYCPSTRTPQEVGTAIVARLLPCYLLVVAHCVLGQLGSPKKAKPSRCSVSLETITGLMHQ